LPSDLLAEGDREDSHKLLRLVYGMRERLMMHADLTAAELFDAAVSYSRRRGKLKAETDADPEKSRSTGQTFVLAAADGRFIDRIPLNKLYRDAEKMKDTHLPEVTKGWKDLPVAGKVTFIFALSALLFNFCRSGGILSSNKISEKDVPGWPLTVPSVEILCDRGKPSIAVVNGVQFALNGLAKAKAEKKGVNLPYLNHEITSLFKPNPDPVLRSRGFLAYMGNDFLDAAARVCE
jgi:hypothetical protein